MSLIRKATCKIKVEIKEGTAFELGTGFFINRKLILTNNHVIKDCDGTINIYKCSNQLGKTLTAKIIDTCSVCDYALLELNEDFENEDILELCNSSIIEQEKIKIFGYPNDVQGQDLGEELTGTISMYTNSNETIQDVILNIEGFASNTKYSAFSGSPVINEYNQVTSILKYQAVRGLSSVSINKAINFLIKNSIDVKLDQLQSFDLYKDKIFLGFEDRQMECEVELEKPLKTLPPQAIISSNGGELFYPKKSQNIGELIELLRKNKDINSKLWTGWIQLLTYVEILKGNYLNTNNINIEITSNELFKKFGLINSTRTIKTNLQLNFYFTEEESYFKIARRSIHDNNKNGLNTYTCNVFNSNIPEFGNTNNIKIDISNPTGSGPSIANVKSGALSLSQLNREVKSSYSLSNASDNLKKIFEDAIK